MKLGGISCRQLGNFFEGFAIAIETVILLLKIIK